MKKLLAILILFFSSQVISDEFIQIYLDIYDSEVLGANASKSYKSLEKCEASLRKAQSTYADDMVYKKSYAGSGYKMELVRIRPREGKFLKGSQYMFCIKQTTKAD